MTHFVETHWFVAQLKPQALKIAITNLDRQGFQHFCPKRLETSLKRGKLSASEKPLFPGYIFVQFDPHEAGWTAINSTRGIVRLMVTDRHKPMPIPDAFMAGLQARCDSRGVLLAPSDLEIGDTVRVLSGPFAETVTQIEEFSEDERLQVLIDLMGQKTKVYVPKVRVEKL